MRSRGVGPNPALQGRAIKPRAQELSREINLMTDKRYMLAEIVRLAKENGGKYPGVRKFESDSGVGRRFRAVAGWR